MRFFSQGLQSATDETRRQMVELIAVQSHLKDRIRSSSLRADSAHLLADLAVANPSFTVRRVESDLGLSNGRANRLVGQLGESGVLEAADPHAHNCSFFAPDVLAVLTSDTLT